MINIIAITGEESEDEIKAMAYAMLAQAHPHECHAHDPERFWTWFHAKAPHLSRKAMEQLLFLTDEEPC